MTLTIIPKDNITKGKLSEERLTAHTVPYPWNPKSELLLSKNVTQVSSQ